MTICQVESADRIKFAVEHTEFSDDTAFDVAVRLPHHSVMVSNALARGATALEKLPGGDQSIIEEDHRVDQTVQDAQCIPLPVGVAHYGIAFRPVLWAGKADRASKVDRITGLVGINLSQQAYDLAGNTGCGPLGLAHRRGLPQQ